VQQLHPVVSYYPTLIYALWTSVLLRTETHPTTHILHALGANWKHNQLFWVPYK